MSRIGKQPIPIPESVDVTITPENVLIKGKQGELTLEQKPGIEILLENNTIIVKRADDTRRLRSMHGLVRSLLANMVTGVTEGYSKTLDMVGVGYKASVKGDTLILNAGYSHPVQIKALQGVKFQVDSDTAITVTSIDKQKLGQVAADIRKVRKPEPYKGKGIKYRDEFIRRKVGKTA